MYLAVLGGLHCCSGFSLVATSRGCPPLVLCWLPSAVASLFEEQGLQGAWVSITVAAGSQFWLLGSRRQGQSLWCMGFIASWHVGSPQTRD